MQLDIPCVKQHRENDCWICCAVMIYNYYFPEAPMDYSSGIIPELIQEYMSAAGLSGDVPASAADCLAYSGLFEVPADQHRLPTFDEIDQAIAEDCPLLCLVKDTPASGSEPDLNCEGGHWVVLCGCLKTRNQRRLLFCDPDPQADTLVSVPYDVQDYEYQDGLYYQNTTYPDKK